MRMRRCWSLAFFGLALQMAGYAQQHQQAYVFICEDILHRTTISGTISIWEKENRIRVTDDASRLIAKEFCEEQKLVLDYIEKRKLDVREQEELLDWLVQSYLYDLRDKTVFTSGRYASPENNRAILRNASVETPGYPEEVVIGVPQVEKFPVAEFFASIRSVLQGSTGEGHLYVTSLPDRASIEIDGKDRGDTCKKFVTSAGRHSVRVRSSDGKLDCKGNLMISPGKTEHFSCPEKTDCPRP